MPYNVIDCKSNKIPNEKGIKVVPDGKEKEDARLECDYLVIGAGTCGMSFVDTLLTEHESASVILADRNMRAGGHWTTAYPFVRLHQPSSNYGVNSLRLSKSKDSKGRERENANDRATAHEILEYYEEVKDQFLDSGRVRCIFGAEYYQTKNGDHMLSLSNWNNEEQNSNDDNKNNINSADKGKPCIPLEKTVYNVYCQKVVRCISNVVVPSMRQGPTFPVDDSIMVKSVNELPNEIDKSNKIKRYVVLGAGKTGSDAILYLLENGIDQSAITWVISRDMWYCIREGYWPTNGESTYRDKYLILKPFLTFNKCADVFLNYEQNGVLGRLQSNSPTIPEVFKGAIIGREELAALRSIKNVIRLGRVTSIVSESIAFEEGNVSLSSVGTAKDILFVDCMAESFCGYESVDKVQLFEPGKISIGPLLHVFNPSFSAAIIAYVEATFNADCDDLKNRFCYYPRGEYAKANLQSLLVYMYSQFKTMDALQQYRPASKFILTSRTNSDAPMHHGGLFKLFWALLGPVRLEKRTKAFKKKVDNGDFGNEAKNRFNLRHEIPQEIPKSVVRVKSKKMKRKGMKKKSLSSLSCYPRKL